MDIGDGDEKLMIQVMHKGRDRDRCRHGDEEGDEEEYG